MRLIRLHEAARMLGVESGALRRLDRDDGYVEIQGLRLRVYRMNPKANGERRFDADEIRAGLQRLQRV